MSAMERARDASERAERRRREQKRRRCVLDMRADARNQMLSLLEETNYSPEKIAWILSHSDLGVRLSGKTIRRWVKRNQPDFQKHYPHRGRRPRRSLTGRTRRWKRPEKAPEKRSVHERPNEIAERARAGDFEIDMIVCSQSTASILSIRDRKTRHSWLELTENREEQTVRQAIIRTLHRICPMLIHTATYDRGGEFAGFQVLEECFGLTAYFCDAYCAWQKGSVENQNKEVRRYIPKGTNLATVTSDELRHVENLLNSKPRESLPGNIASADAYALEVAKVRAMLH